MVDSVVLGRTGLRASVLGLGGGGHSRLGQQTGLTVAQSRAIVRRALEMGVNMVDTAEVYGTEELIGQVLRETRREDIVLSTKKSLTHDGQLITAADLIRGLEDSLVRLQTNFVDIYHLHGLRPDQYDYAVAELVPAMTKLRDQGKVRFLGVTESFQADPGHAMLARAVNDNHWDVVMVGFNILNQSARERVLPAAWRHQIGVLCMFAVRVAFSRPEKFRETIVELVRQDLVDKDALDKDDPLALLGRVAESLPDAAYRFCRAEPGIHVVLSGTGNAQHLEQNIASILRPPLPDSVRQRLVDLFASVDTVTGQ